MKRLLILGGGTGGTIILNKIFPILEKSQWQITIIDQDNTHYYQPGFLFVPFEIYSSNDVVKPRRKYFPSGVDLIQSKIGRIIPDQNKVILEHDISLDYDFLIIATGAGVHPEETDGMLDESWQINKFEYYTFDGANRLAEFFKTFKGGKIVVNITEMPIKCPVAPLEFLFLADSYFTERGIRNKVDLVFATPLPGAFTRPIASKALGNLLAKKNIGLIPEFNIGRVDSQNRKLISWDDNEISVRCLDHDPN